MTPNDFFSQFVQQFNAMFGPGFESLSKEARDQLRSAAQATFDRLDLVTREEFDAQRAVLTRTREKLEHLEKQLAELEGRLEQ